MPLEPIHDAALAGDEAEVVRLVGEDGTRLNAQVQGATRVDGWAVDGCTALMLAAYRGHDAVVTRLLALRADVGLKDAGGGTAVHWACAGKHASSLSLLLDAGDSLNSFNTLGCTPLMVAASSGAEDCAALLIARGGSALDLNAQSNSERATALHLAAYWNHPAVVSLLLQAGADPTLRTKKGHTPFNLARQQGNTDCIALLQAALAEPQRPRLLFKARALCEAAHHITHARALARTRGQAHTAPLAAAPAYLRGRVERREPLPQVQISTNDEELTACLRFVLGLQGHGGWAGAEDERATMRTEGLFPELFVELLELVVPRWDGARKGQPLGEGWE